MFEKSFHAQEQEGHDDRVRRLFRKIKILKEWACLKCYFPVGFDAICRSEFDAKMSLGLL